VHACNPSYPGGRDTEDHSLRPIWQKVSETPSQQTSPVWWYTPVIPATLEAQVGLRSKDSPGQKHKTLSKKITKARQDWEHDLNGGAPA
jgi:hypothetical protein